MDKLLVKQSMNLCGTIQVSGAKNASLPIICAGILSSGMLELTNVPRLNDIKTLKQLLVGMGLSINWQDHTMQISADNITNHVAPYELVKTMRASILVLGPLLARFGEAVVSLPGGCAIGARPVDQHIKGLEQMGAEITIEHGFINAKCKKLKGAHIVMDVVTVTGTENLLMAATLAEGTTILENCAREPEVTDLVHCLLKMGAKIAGVGTDTLVIEGVKELHGANHSVVADRIEAGTYLVLATMTQSDLYLEKVKPSTMSSVIEKLRVAGAKIEEGNDFIHIMMDKRSTAIDIATSPYPAFPTDMQAQFMALNTVATGTSRVSENIFENRFMHVSELLRLGANIEVDGNIAIIKGVNTLLGAKVMATDLRASASLVLAGAVAEGETLIDRVYHLDRGYEKMEVKLAQVGLNIERI